MSNINKSNSITESTSNIPTNNAIINYDYNSKDKSETSSVINVRYVPMDLIPVNTVKINLVWAKKTYKYSNYFDINTFPNECYNNEHELLQWIKYAKLMQEELREIGKKAAIKEVIRVFDQDCGFFMPNTQQTAKSFNDIISIIEDKNWYYTRINRNRHAIHKISYGIYHSYYNKWMKDEANEWLRKRKICLSNVDIEGKLILSFKEKNPTSRNGKGFVYSNLIMRATNTLVDRIQHAMRKVYGEYIVVRNKNKNNNNVRYEKMKIPHHTAFIVKEPENILLHISEEEKLIRDMKITYEAWSKDGITEEKCILICQKVYGEIAKKKVLYHGKILKLCII